MADMDDFKKAVKDACQYFGGQDWGQLENSLHDDVVMKRLDDPQKFHSGKPDVMHYFRTRGQDDKGRLEYDPDDPNTRWLIVDGPKLIGVVSGKGRFFDTLNAVNAKHPRTIAFSFSFAKVGQKWLAINLWGAYC